LKKKILVLGGAGFIGSHLVDVCLLKGHGVVVYDNFSRGKREYLPKHEDLSIVTEDILDLETLKSTVNEYKPEIVFHLAAEHFIPACEEMPGLALRKNVEGTQNVLTATTNIVEKIIFASTGAIYDPEITDSLNESSNIKTGDIYGITKQTCEELIKYHVKKGRGKVIIARLFNAVGRRETNPHLVPAIMEQLASGERHIELGNLYPRRDYVHVEDIAEALYSLGLNEIESDVEIFNIGSGKEYSVEELVKMCGEVMNEPIKIESVPERRRKYDRPNQLADITRIKNVTGWEPSRNLRQALEEIWNDEIIQSNDL
jgi:UDP-glucose 4-epimerase